ncbi:MAG: AN1-type zinc finger domain-containing protein [Candidatus Hodarchaeales archaeon]|jgi:Zn-dependent protease
MIRIGFLRRLQFSEIELQHLLIGTALFTGVMLSWFLIPYDLNISLTAETLIFSILLTGLSAPLFFLHEIGHKLSAQHYNMWAEFRLNEQGVMLTAISMLPFFPIKFIAPGAVQVRGYSDVPTIGKVSAYGPTVNVIIGGIYLFLAGVILTINEIFVSMDVFSEYTELLELLITVFTVATWFSFFLGGFNMLPFGPLDGKKVNTWNSQVFWGLLLVCGLMWFEINVQIVWELLGDIEPIFLVFYPLILGSLNFIGGYLLLQRLKDPHFDPGKPTQQYDDYSYPHFTGSSPLGGDTQIRVKRTTSTTKKKLKAFCAECGEGVLLPFNCSTCGGYYCANHRLPGRHFCYVDHDKV